MRVWPNPNVPYLKTFAFSEPATAILGGGVRGIIRNDELLEMRCGKWNSVRGLFTEASQASPLNIKCSVQWIDTRLQISCLFKRKALGEKLGMMNYWKCVVVSGMAFEV